MFRPGVDEEIEKAIGKILFEESRASKARLNNNKMQTVLTRGERNLGGVVELSHQATLIGAEVVDYSALRNAGDAIINITLKRKDGSRIHLKLVQDETGK